MSVAKCITEKRKEVKNGIVYAELKKLFINHMSDGEYGFSNVEIRRAPKQTSVTITAMRKNIDSRNFGVYAKQVQGFINLRFSDWLGNNVDVAFASPENRGLDASIQCESVAFKMVGGLAVRRACYGVLRFIMESGADGCEIVVAGKLRGQRAKAMKFTQGKMIHSGYPAEVYIRESVRHIKMKQGILGIKVRILLGFDPTGKKGPSELLPDTVQVSKWSDLDPRKTKQSTLTMWKKDMPVGTPNQNAYMQQQMIVPQQPMHGY